MKTVQHVVFIASLWVIASQAAEPEGEIPGEGPAAGPSPPTPSPPSPVPTPSPPSPVPTPSPPSPVPSPSPPSPVPSPSPVPAPSPDSGVAKKVNKLESEVSQILTDEKEDGTSHKKSKVVFVLLNMFGLGCCGIDRCYLGNVGLGFAKFLTCGGCLVWACIDFILIIANALQKEDGISSMGMEAKFQADSIDVAYILAWISLALCISQSFCSVCCKGHCRSHDREDDTSSDEEHAKHPF
eukprot:TRINITY_DN5240_c0_g1_i1.p1 TRINITY_DN5240_c0_g1~~TRINITY_DN5240_c0_g1_i1.p1  ORF type:complete len:240 (+),score=60.07 TRINITY_DN5240_c0_g1_i1:72-791(+)